MLLTNPYSNESYSEEAQSLVVKFAICKPVGNGYETIHNFVNCRDFLSDVIFWHQNKIYNRTLYRFQIETKNLQTIHPYLAIESKHLDNILSNINQLKGVGKITGWVNNTCVIEFDPIWFANSVNISLLSLTLKVLAYKHNTPITTLVEEILQSKHKEKEYIKKIKPERFITLITGSLKNLSSDMLVMDNNEEFLSWGNSAIHEYLGIVSLFNPHSPKSNLMRYYQKQKQKKVAIERNKLKNPNPCSSLLIANNLT
jgi:hypothetical protein